MHFELLQIALLYYSATNRAFSVVDTCGLSTTPTLLACGDATVRVHAQGQCRKGLVECCIIL